MVPMAEWKLKVEHTSADVMHLDVPSATAEHASAKLSLCDGHDGLAMLRYKPSNGDSSSASASRIR